MMAKWLDTMFGPMRLRAWGLVINMIANAIALYGLAIVLRGEGGVTMLIVGSILTVCCIGILAVPQERSDS